MLWFEIWSSLGWTDNGRQDPSLYGIEDNGFMVVGQSNLGGKTKKEWPDHTLEEFGEAMY
jgi:hypothetical protein